MYEENNVTYNVGINWKDIIVKIILIILFVLFLVWLFPKTDLDVIYDSVYTNNIKTMKDAAKSYYTKDRLPENVGESKSMTLKEMIDNKMLIRFTDKDKNYCDETASKVEVTKTSEEEYVLKVQLNCGEQKDYILETIGCNDVCVGKECTIIENNTIADNTVDNNNNEDDSDVNYSDPKNPSEDDLFTQSTIYYQHKKAITTTKTIYTCPTGYVKDGTKCVRETTGATIDATPVYGPDQIITSDAKYNYTGDYTVYADYIKTKVDTEYSCPTGYVLNGSYCVKYTDAIEIKGEDTYTCPSGYTKNGTSCYKVYDASANTTYSCPNGGKLDGKKCNVSNGYNASANVTYGSWVSQGARYYTTANKAYTGTTDKLVYQGAISGAICGTPCGNKGIWYKYIYYTRSKNTTYSCPNGGKLNGTWCDTSYSYDATPKTSYTCPNGGVLDGTKCTITKDATVVPGQSTYKCAVGTLTADNKCKITIDATPEDVYSYTCPAGYTASGKGAATICSKVEKGENIYYCPNVDAELDGTKCILKVKGEITGYTCPAGYDKVGIKCVKKSTSTIDASVTTDYVTSYKYTWSTKSYLDGWTATGKTKTVTNTYTAGQK